MRYYRFYKFFLNLNLIIYTIILIIIKNIFFVLVVLDSIQDNTDDELNKNNETINMNPTVSLSGNYIILILC